MNADVFAEWLRRQGCLVIRTASSYWYDAGMKVFQAFPYHWIIEPTDNELRRLLLDHRGIALRYSAPIDASQGLRSYHVVCEDTDYDLSSLRRQARQSIQRGLDYASVEPIPLSRLASEGWNLRMDTLKRQGRAKAENREWWRRLCLSAQDLPGFESWGALRDGHLIASFLAFRCDDCYTLPYEQSATAYLESRANNAIFYSVTRHALRRADISRVFYGLQSLDAPASVDQFKFRMGFVARPVRQRVVFHPWLEPLAVNTTHAMLKRLLRRVPGNRMLAKAEGIVRFYLQGKRPLCEQDSPEHPKPAGPGVFASRLCESRRHGQQVFAQEQNPR